MMPEERVAYNRAYYHAHKKEIAAYSRAYYAKNADRIRAQRRAEKKVEP